MRIERLLWVFFLAGCGTVRPDVSYKSFGDLDVEKDQRIVERFRTPA